MSRQSEQVIKDLNLLHCHPQRSPIKPEPTDVKPFVSVVQRQHYQHYRLIPADRLRQGLRLSALLEA